MSTLNTNYQNRTQQGQSTAAAPAPEKQSALAQLDGVLTSLGRIFGGGSPVRSEDRYPPRLPARRGGAIVEIGTRDASVRVSVGRGVLLDDAQFNRLYSAVKGRFPSDSDRLERLEAYGGAVSYTSAQAGKMLDLFQFEEGRTRAMDTLIPSLQDPHNAASLERKLKFSDEKQHLRDLLRWR